MNTFCTTHPTKLEVKVFNFLGDVTETWDLIVPGDHSLFSGNLKVLESAKPDDMDFKYLTIRKKGVLKGVVYLQHLKIKQSHFNGTAIDKPGLGWLKKLVNGHFSDVLICGNLFRIHFPGFYFKDPGDDNLIFEVLTDYLRSAGETDNFCGLLLKDCPQTFDETGRFKPYHDDVTMELEIKETWTSFEEYEKSISKKYRQRCRKIRKARGLLEVKEFSLNDIVENAERLEELYLNVALKQNLRIGFVNAAYFREMKVRHNDSFIFKGYYLANKLVAFSSHILYADRTMEIHFIGLDYDFNEKYFLYFNVLFDGLEIAISHQMKRLELGRTARVAKASLGAIPVQVHNYVLLKRGIPSLAFYFFNNWFVKNMGDDWNNRTPFK